MKRRFDDTDLCEDTGDAPVSGHNGSFKRWVHDGDAPAPCRPEFAERLAATREAAKASAVARRAAWGGNILAGV